MPEPVLEEIRDEMMNYKGSGMCVMEMSHRSPVYQQIIDEAEQDLRDLMNIPDNYKVLFIQGGATLQFAMIPMNLMKNGVACYVETGAWSKKAIAEAKKYGEVHVAASSKDRNFCYIPLLELRKSGIMLVLLYKPPSLRKSQGRDRGFLSVWGLPQRQPWEASPSLPRLAGSHDDPSQPWSSPDHRQDLPDQLRQSHYHRLVLYQSRLPLPPV